MKIMAKKYILNPGYIKASDGDLHYIGAIQLCELYNVSIKDCIIADREMMKAVRDKSLIGLYPRSDGNYRLAMAQGNAN